MNSLTDWALLTDSLSSHTPISLHSHSKLCSTVLPWVVGVATVSGVTAGTGQWDQHHHLSTLCTPPLEIGSAARTSI